MHHCKDRQLEYFFNGHKYFEKFMQCTYFEYYVSGYFGLIFERSTLTFLCIRSILAVFMFIWHIKGKYLEFINMRASGRYLCIFNLIVLKHAEFCFVPFLLLLQIKYQEKQIFLILSINA